MSVSAHHKDRNAGSDERDWCLGCPLKDCAGRYTQACPLERRGPFSAAEYAKSPLEAQFYAQVESSGLPLPARQVRICGHRADFCWVPQRIVVEIQGGTWTQGAHVRGVQYAKDRLLSNLRQLAGWMVMEFTGDHLNHDEALPLVKAALEKREVQ